MNAKDYNNHFNRIFKAPNTSADKNIKRHEDNLAKNNAVEELKEPEMLTPDNKQPNTTTAISVDLVSKESDSNIPIEENSII